MQRKIRLKISRSGVSREAGQGRKYSSSAERLSRQALTAERKLEGALIPSPYIPRLLLCEGNDDKGFLEALIQANGLPSFHIVPSHGNTKFAQALAAFQIQRPKHWPNIRHILVIADNDKAPKDSFDNVQRELNSVLGSGATPNRHKVRSTRTPTVSVFMLPTENIPGHLESYIAPTAQRSELPTGEHVATFMANVRAEDWGCDCRLGKATLRSNLAARCDDPCATLTEVFSEARNRHLIPVTAGNPDFAELVAFLESYRNI
jgi:hypothetical protein